jgi:gluconokinase
VIIIVMGVAGSGKSIIGRLLANVLGHGFLDGDSLHPAENVKKMAQGIPLTDSDRAPSLAAIRVRLEEASQQRQNLVVACSALKQLYRDYLTATVPVTWVYLKGAEELIRSRLEERHGHYMKAKMLASQLEILEEPANGIVADVSLAPERIVQQILPPLRRKAAESHAPKQCSLWSEIWPLR